MNETTITEIHLVTQGVKWGKPDSCKYKIQTLDWFVTTYWTNVSIEVSAYDFWNALYKFVCKTFGEGYLPKEMEKKRGWIDDGTSFAVRRNGSTGLWEFTVTTTYEPPNDVM